MKSIVKLNFIHKIMIYTGIIHNLKHTRYYEFDIRLWHPLYIISILIIASSFSVVLFFKNFYEIIVEGFTK